MDTTRSRKAIAIGLGALFFLNPVLVAAQNDNSNNNRPHQELERLVALSSDHTAYDSDDFSFQELAASAVSPFCKSFTFLCHVRCLQRGDAKDPTNARTPSAGQAVFKGEINRCTHVPNTNTNRVLCLCNNGVDLTAEVDYALEGVVDIEAAGGDGVGTGEAGKIREVVYSATKTLTKVVTTTQTVTTTVTSVAPASACTTVTEAVAAVADSLGTVPAAKSVQTPPPVEAETPGDSDAPRLDNGDEAGKPEEQDDDDGNGVSARSESVTRIGAHHGIAKVKKDPARQGEPRMAANSKALSQFGVVAQELGQTGDLANDPDAYQDPYLEQELAGMFDNGELQANADEAEVEAEEEQYSKLSQGRDENDEDDSYDYESDEDAYEDEEGVDDEEGQNTFRAASADDREYEDEDAEETGAGGLEVGDDDK
ncbi:hypothetical protein EC957_011793 [Mortierella hygrophila]|uniref:Uncharacterized protein n=1 Tax=Mortierella hygrophila TaxID=979708 RepID=A0A9P6F873_9FUNG|nr:hypothetical protein EC957_011793 [Mortierella hygrophila]